MKDRNELNLTGWDVYRQRRGKRSLPGGGHVVGKAKDTEDKEWLE